MACYSWWHQSFETDRGKVWQAKHDKSGLSWKSPIEFQWSICEIEKSLREIGKSLREIRKTLYEKLKLLYENEKIVMRDHNYQSRMKNCHVRLILTVDNEKSLCEKKKAPYEIIDWFFLSRRDITSQRKVFWRDFLLSCGQYKTWTADYGLRTTDYGLGIKYGLRYKTRTENYELIIKHEERFYIEWILARTFL